MPPKIKNGKMSHETNFCLLLKNQEMCGKSGPAAPQSRSCLKLTYTCHLPTSQWTWTCARQSAAILSPPFPCPLLHPLNSPADVQELESFLPLWKNKLVQRECTLTEGGKMEVGVLIAMQWLQRGSGNPGWAKTSSSKGGGSQR